MYKIRLPALFMLLCFIFLNACSQTPSYVMELDAKASANCTSAYSNHSMFIADLTMTMLSPSSSDSDLIHDTSPVAALRPRQIRKPVLDVSPKKEANVLPIPKAIKEPEPTNTPAPTEKPEPTKSPKPTKKPEPTKTPVPTETPAPSPTSTTDPTSAPTDDTPSETPALEDTSSPEEDAKKVSNKPMGVPESSPVDMSYFDDALFIGDSNTWRFRNFVHKKRKSDQNYMGKAAFLCEIGFGLHHSLLPLGKSSIHVKCEEGKQWEIVEFIKQNSFNKIYIMLGTNDIGLNGVDKTVNYYVKLIKEIKAVSDADIYIQSVLPMGKHKQKRVLNNKNIEKFNKKMYEQSKSLNCYYLDVASCLKDSEGNLPNKYSSDKYVHLSNAAFPLWVEYLRTHTK